MAGAIDRMSALAGCAPSPPARERPKAKAREGGAAKDAIPGWLGRDDQLHGGEALRERSSRRSMANPRRRAELAIKSETGSAARRAGGGARPPIPAVANR